MNDEERILPLINVVFLLLIFFLLAGRLAASDPFEVLPPRSASAGPIGIQDIVILVGADGRLALDGLVVKEAELESALSNRKAAATESQVWLKADSRAEAARVIAVMERLRDAGVEKLTLLSLAESE